MASRWRPEKAHQQFTSEHAGRVAGEAARFHLQNASEVGRLFSFANMKFEVKPDGAGKYRWKLIGDNGEVLAISPVSYSKFDTNQRIKLIQAMARASAIEGIGEGDGTRDKAGF